MGKVYYVIIKGRTLESRNLKELLSRAVTQKRNLDRRLGFRPQYSVGSPVENSLGACAAGSSEARA